MNVVRFNLRERVAPPRKKGHAPRRGDRAARQLALAYRVEQGIDAGEIRDHAHAASLLGISRGRISQVAALTTLAADIQTRILAGENIHERALRAALRFVDWNQQRAALQGHQNEAEN